MKVYTFRKANDPKTAAIILAFNKGHAVKMLAKALEAKGLKLEDDPLVEVSVEDERKGKVIFFE